MVITLASENHNQIFVNRQKELLQVIILRAQTLGQK